jgi:hypothetical protein
MRWKRRAPQIVSFDTMPGFLTRCVERLHKVENLGFDACQKTVSSEHLRDGGVVGQSIWESGPRCYSGQKKSAMQETSRAKKLV